VNLILRPAAAADVEAAYRWYERQRAGLGDDFLATVGAALRAIEANPEVYPVVHEALGESWSDGSRTHSSIVSWPST